MQKRSLKTLFSFFTIFALLTGMMILSPLETALASETANILFKQTPTGPTDEATNAYTSTAVSDIGGNDPYWALDDFWGASDYGISHVQWFGVAAKDSYWHEGNPSGMEFQIIFYERNSDLTFMQVAEFTHLFPAYQPYGGQFPFGIDNSVQGYSFDVYLETPVLMTSGWISIRNTSNATDGSTFLWLNSREGNDYFIQYGNFNGSDHAGRVDDLAFTLTGTTPRNYTVTFQAGTDGSLTGTTAFPNILSGEEWTSAVPTLPTPVPAFGYKFGSWSPIFPANVRADVTYTANFVRDEDPNHWFTVNFQAGAHGWLGGTSDFYDILSGSPWASAVKVPTPNGDPGYKFGSWSPGFPDSVTGSATYTANYVIDPSQTFTVTYDGNGNTSGTVPTDGTTYHSGDTVTVLGSNRLQQTGCYFAGWVTYDGRELLWKPGSTFVGAADITLYAKWVTTDENTATLSGTRSARPGQKVTFNASLSGAGLNNFIPPGSFYFYCSADPFSYSFSNLWNPLAEKVLLVRGKASLTVNSLTSPGTYYIYARYVPDDSETYNGCVSNVWTVKVK